MIPLVLLSVLYTARPFVDRSIVAIELVIFLSGCFSRFDVAVVAGVAVEED